MAKTTMNLQQKLLEVKKRVPYLQKDKEGHQYKYATPSQVLGALNPILNELGVRLKSEVVSSTSERVWQKPKMYDVYKGKEKTHIQGDVYETMFHLTMKFTWIDVDSGEKEECHWMSSGVNGDEKGLGSALTYAERYFLLKTFNIPTDNDDPDSFQTKHMSDEEREKKEAELKKKQEEVAVKQIEGMIEAANEIQELGAIKKEYKAWYAAYPHLKELAAKKAEALGFVPKKEEQPVKTEEAPVKEQPKPEATQPTPPAESEANFAGMKKEQEPIAVEAEEVPSTLQFEMDVDAEIELLKKFKDKKSLILHTRKVSATMESSGMDASEINRFQNACNVIAQNM
jgi:hypothetical protein